jgi:serine/threonine-protein kinase
MSFDSQRARDIFVNAVGKVPREEWDVYVAKACEGDPALLARVQQLLQAHIEAGSISEASAPQADALPDGRPVREGAGSVIGPYKLLEQIGEGGFGVVFMADQQHPVRRKVALKVIKPGMDTRQVIARFEAERQALALMDHPNIAHVLDAGETDSGLPYFVMELVRGIPITEFCDQNLLTPIERLELFIAVCQAVQHAHQKGIIHRDLKPANVLVTLHDGTPVPKVIDFGIAKATGQQLTEKTLFTNFAQMIGTPLYMSPDQAALSGLDVDTRSDVYSLGVLLYELLTGTTPFDKERLRTAAYDEIRRIIREEEPPRPSKRLSTLGATLTAVSAHRKTDPKRLGQLVRGELDWIVMKALEKDRRRRYETASAMAADVQRYLRDEPVSACPPSAAYRFRKFAQRNRAGLVVAVGLFFMLAVLAGAIAWSERDRAARRAAVEQEAADAVNEAGRLLGQGKYLEALSAAKRAEGVLAGGGEQLRRRAGDLRADAEMALRLEDVRLTCEGADPTQMLFSYARTDRGYAQAFGDFGIDVDALEPAPAAERIRARAIALELARALDDWAMTRQRVRPADEASRAALVARCKHLLAVARAADPDPWRNRLRDAIEQRDRKRLTELARSEEVATLPAATLHLLARSFYRTVTVDSALTVMRLAQKRYPGDFWINFYLGAFLAETSPPQWDEASRFFTVAVALRGQSALPWHNLGNALLEMRNLDEAIPAIREAIRLAPEFASSRFILGRALRGKREWGAAIDSFREAIRLAPQSAKYHHTLGWLLASCPDPAWRNAGQAVQLAQRCVELDAKSVDGWTTLGVAQYRSGDWNAAVAALKKSEELRPAGARINWFFLAMAEWQRGNPEQARNWYARAVQRTSRAEAQNEQLRRFRAEAAELIRP